MIQGSHTSLIALVVAREPDHSKTQVWSAEASDSGTAGTAGYQPRNVRSAEKVSGVYGWDVGSVVMVVIRRV